MFASIRAMFWHDSLCDAQLRVAIASQLSKFAMSNTTTIVWASYLVFLNWQNSTLAISLFATLLGSDSAVSLAVVSDDTVEIVPLAPTARAPLASLKVNIFDLDER